MITIGLDVGTSSLKVCAMDEYLNVHYENSYAYAYEEPQEGYREIYPQVWMDAVIQALRDAYGIIDKDEDTMIGVTGQMHTVVFLKANGEPVCPAILWTDLRATHYANVLKEELRKIPETTYIAQIMSPGSWAANTIWLKEERPDLFAQLAHIMGSYDYIVYRLCGQYGYDYSGASTSAFYDIQSKQWSKIMLAHAGIDMKVLSTTYPSTHVMGELLDEWCEMLQLSHRPKIIMGTGDNPANAVSLHLMQHSEPVISLGTSGVVLLAKDDGDFEGIGKNVLFASKEGNLSNVVQGTVRAAGGAQKWWVENIVESKEYAIDQEKIEEADLGKNKVLFFPHITGDKLVYHDMNVRGAFIGLSANTKRKDMTQAVLEGVAFALRDTMEKIGLKQWPSQVRVNGGGSKSTVWMDILANVLHTKIKVVQGQSSPVYGVCMLALQAAGYTSSQVNEIGITHEYDVKIVQAYETAYQTYLKIYDALKTLE